MDNINKPVEAIVLAGGRGTRLQSVSNGLPKPMMPVCDRPFLAYLLQKLLGAGLRRTILSVGYRHEVIRSYFGDDFEGMQLTYCVEETLLGTGGALAEALLLSSDDDLMVLNGDSYFDVDIVDIFKYHMKFSGDITIALKKLDDCSRFGTVTVVEERVTAFREKGLSGNGYINSGVYVINRRIAEDLQIGRRYSFETDVLEKIVSTRKVLPYINDGYFIDIGIPEDYRRAQTELSGLIGATR